MKDIKVCYGIDVDCVAGWLGSYGGEDSPCDISRGVFAGRVGIPRLLDLFDRYGIKTTWFSCGHSIETFPEQMKDVVARGHEIGLHGYSHENPLAMTPEQEEKILLHTIDLVTELSEHHGGNSQKLQMTCLLNTVLNMIQVLCTMNFIRIL